MIVLQIRLPVGVGGSLGSERVDLVFGLHPSPEGDRLLWHELHRQIRLGPGREIRVVLGQHTPLEAALFGALPRWISLREEVDGALQPELGERVVILAPELALRERLATLEEAVQATGIDAADHGRLLSQIGQLRARAEVVDERLAGLEQLRAGVLGTADPRPLPVRLDALEEGFGRVESEVADLVGENGDIIDLHTRLEQVERAGGRTVPAYLPVAEPLSVEAFRRIDEIETRLERLMLELGGIRQAMSAVRGLAADLSRQTSWVQRGGDAMTGSLTLAQGDLDVKQGTVKAERLEGESARVQGQLTVRSVLVDQLRVATSLELAPLAGGVKCRVIEGVLGPPPFDGRLFLNPSGGGSVEVGSRASRHGLRVHGEIESVRMRTSSPALVTCLPAAAPIQEGAVLSLGSDGRVRPSQGPADPAVLGVATSGGLVLDGGACASGDVELALQGKVRVQAEARCPIAIGDLLVSSEIPGFARARQDSDPPGCRVLGRALEALGSERACISMLIWPG